LVFFTAGFTDADLCVDNLVDDLGDGVDNLVDDLGDGVDDLGNDMVDGIDNMVDDLGDDPGDATNVDICDSCDGAIMLLD